MNHNWNNVKYIFIAVSLFQVTFYCFTSHRMIVPKLWHAHRNKTSFIIHFLNNLFDFLQLYNDRIAGKLKKFFRDHMKFNPLKYLDRRFRCDCNSLKHSFEFCTFREEFFYHACVKKRFMKWMNSLTTIDLMRSLLGASLDESIQQFLECLMKSKVTGGYFFGM